jgi:hypothetical protein
MSATFKVALVALAAVLTAALGASTASANYEVRSGGVSFTGHFLISAESATQVWKTSTGAVISCSTLTGEGLIESKSVGEVEGHVGRIKSLAFGQPTHAPTTECDSTISSFTECAKQFVNVPHELRALGTTVHIVSTGLGNPGFTQVCEASNGTTLSCTYSVAKIVGTWAAGTHKVSINQTFALTAGGFLCPSSGTWTGTLGIKTEAGGEVILTNV